MYLALRVLTVAIVVRELAGVVAFALGCVSYVMSGNVVVWLGLLDES